MKTNYILFFLLVSLPSFSQILEDFENNKLNQDSTWHGDTHYFTVNDGMLKSDGPKEMAAKIFLTAENNLINNTEWVFCIDLKFNPTSANFTRIYLISDNKNLNNPLNGYFIQLGQSNDDFIKFFRQDGMKVNELSTGKTTLGKNNIKIYIKVLRDNVGNWSIYSTKDKSLPYESIGPKIFDSTYSTTSYFGIYCEYSTLSRATQFYFDDIGIRSIFNQESNDTTDINLPEPPSQGDIVINEILFNPKPGGVDFIELFNKSDRKIDLRNWKIKVDNSIVPFPSHSLILPPDGYYVLSKDKSMIQQHYPMAHDDNFIGLNLPNLKDDKGKIVLYNPTSFLIDSIEYNENYHFDLISNKEGVSLERINPEIPGWLKENWYSASSNSGYATPGYKNSQYLKLEFDSEFTIAPKVITPDEDGYNDFTLFTYKFPQTGNMAEVIIFDLKGREIKRVAKNELIGPEGFFQWNGTNENGNKVIAGQYIVYCKIFKLNGETKEFKDTVVVGY